MAKTLVAALEEIELKSSEMAKVFEEAGPEMDMDLVTSLDGTDVQTTEQKVAWIQEREKELSDLNQAARQQADLLKASENNGMLGTVLDLMKAPSNALAHAVADVEGSTKTFGEQFTDAYDPTEKGREIDLKGFDIKTLFETTAGWAPESIRTGKVVDDAQRPVQITDVIPFTTTGSAAVVYMEETTFTNAAAAVAEGGTLAESAFALTQVTSPVQRIGHWIPVTDEQLEDVQQVQGYLNNRLQFGLRQTLDNDLLQGSGTPPALDGLLNRAGIQTYALSAEPAADAILKGLDLVRNTGRAIPNAVMIHTTDWQQIRLLRTADGVYIWGNPSSAGVETIWGLPIVKNQVVTVGTALVGDFANFSEFAVRRGVTVKVSDSHASHFITGTQAIRADMRGALQCYRPAAFATVTGI